MANKQLTPSYLDADFATLRQKFVDELGKLDSFKDYNFEGSNISMLIEFFAYMQEMNTYYLNKIAKNVYDETADLYDNVHRLATFRGYYPKGTISPMTDVTATITQDPTKGEDFFAPGDQLLVPAWYPLSAVNGSLPYLTTRAFYGTIPPSASDSYAMSFTVKQGTVYAQTYTGSEIVDNQLILPFFSFDHDDNIEDEIISILVEVNSEPWTRIGDFYDDISGLQKENNVYTFNYDKYKRYNIEFSSARNVPTDTDTIKVTLIKSLGINGAVGAGQINQSTTGLIVNTTRGTTIPIDNIVLSNPLATSPGSSPQDIDTIKKAARGFLHAQYRCVSKADYIAFLETRSDIVAANAWGEQEVAPDGLVSEYNKVRLTAIPTSWHSGTVAVSASSWTPFPNVTGTINIPTTFSPLWQQTLRSYLEPRKMLNVYELFVTPELVYFAFNIGLKIKRSYNFALVMQDVKAKLGYYFSSQLKEFGATINFMDITNFITDSTIISDTSSFENVKGIDSLIIRDITSNLPFYSYGTENTTQLLLQSANLNTTPWAKNGLTVTESSSGCTLTKTASAAGYVEQAITMPVSSMINMPFTFSVYLKSGTYTGNVTLTLVDGGGNNISSPFTITPTTTLTRYSITGYWGINPTANMKVRITTATGGNGQNFIAQNAQLEQLSHASAYQESTTVQTTRYAYPQYTRAEFDSYIDNKLKIVELGLLQYPMCNTDLCLITQES